MIEELRKKANEAEHTMVDGKYKTRDGMLYSRVTSILNAVRFDDGALDVWRKKLTIAAFSKSIDLSGVYRGSHVITEFSKALASPDEATRGAAGFGTRVHEYIEEYFNTGVFPILKTEGNSDIMICLESVKKFLIDNDLSPKTVDVIKPEMFIYSKTYKYAGTADFVCFRNGNAYLFDWKTSNRFRDQYKCQLSAYAHALKEAYGINIKKANCVRFEKSKIGYEIHSYNEQELKENFNIFKACLIMYNFIKHLPLPSVNITFGEEEN